ncbi:MAG: class I SAM-dependent DNA methyltransferase, partial [Acidaminococcaceae bacterium]|nr:class I SAM-dependent DNA methyltransferase [Acidaminococcaceae bacterium]
MNDTEQRKAARAFANRWQGKGSEKADDRSYWTQLLQEVYGIEDATKYYEAAKKVEVLESDGKKHSREIDIYIPSAKVLIEQKGVTIDLSKKGYQSGGDLMSPYEQAKRYNDWLGKEEAARWIITCNFAEFWVYDMNNPTADPLKIRLEELPDRLHELDFLIDDSIRKIRQEAKISEDAGRLVGQLYDALRKMYAEPDAPETLHGLNVLMVRLVFLLYAEDAGLLQAHNAFGDFVKSYKPENLRSGLKDLFRVLDEEEAERDPDEPQKLLAFPYINGGLFSNAQKIRIPQFSDEAYDILLNKMSYEMDWSAISPTIFGMVFESTLDSKMRHAGGMHYTSLENIHKILDHLFLNDLRAELDEIKGISTKRKDGSRNAASLNAKNARLDDFREKLSKIHILDPAAGSGNFLTESYLSLRKLENEAISERYKGEIILSDLEETNPIKVSLDQFHGIEINDFAVAVNKTALWIAEAQMYEETRALVTIDANFLPLRSNSNIMEGNALQMDWSEVCPKDKLTFIVGNPPFLGYTQQSKEQKADLQKIHPASKNIDYVAGWYFKAAEFIQGTQIRAAFVSTNSITQGEQVAAVWKPIFEKYGVHIDFAFRTFKWESESTDAAAVHVVIVAFSSAASYKEKFIFADGKKEIVKNINPYLIDAPIIFIEDRKMPLCHNVTIMNKGSQGTDDGHFYFEVSEYQNLIKGNPEIGKFIKEATNGKTFINNTKKYCLWCKGLNPAELKKFPILIERIKLVESFRKNSPKKSTQKWAAYPYLFTEDRQPEKGNYLLVPLTSSEKRNYVPIGYLPYTVIANNSVQIVPDATLYDFGIIMSFVFMSWMRAVCGRLEMRYRITVTNVYNNFPWPEPTDQQKEKIEQTAQAILDARAKYPESSLADLYDPLLMPP